MAADQLAGTQLYAHGGSPATPSAQDAKAQATKIYEALDAKGYGIVKRQQVADALPDNKVVMQRKHLLQCDARRAYTDVSAMLCLQYIFSGTDVQPIIRALHLDTEGTISKTLFIKVQLQL